MTAKTKSALLALVIAGALIWTLPAASLGKSVDLGAASDALRQLGGAVGQTVTNTDAALREARAKTEAALRKAKADLAKRQAAQREAERETRAPTTDPLRQPPLHGANPHGQGGVAVVDLDPSNERPLDANPDGAEAGEDVVVGRARGEQTASGAYHGHITILSLFGNELLGVDSREGESKTGPLQPLQTGVLDPLCDATNQQVCLSILTANSVTTKGGSSNDFALARASVLGLDVGAAESGGVIAADPNCQSAGGTGKTANVVARGGGAIAQVANSASTSKSCRGQAPQTANSSMVIALGGTQLPLPAAGCADGTPDTVGGLPPLLPIVCNADEIAGAAAVREALDVYVLNSGGSSLAKESTGSAESLTVAPAGPEKGPQCSDGVDNDGDGKVDAKDPGCHSDGNPNNPASYVPSDNDETDSPGTGPSGDENGGTPQCSDRRDNDGDGLVDAKDPGCHTDGNPNNPASFDPDDDSEGDGGGGGGGGGDDDARALDEGALPFTGTDVVGLAFAGLLLLAGGLLMRRREVLRTGR